MRGRVSTLTTLALLSAVVALLVFSCRSPSPTAMRSGHEISACGELFDIGTPVVLWHDEGGYDAYARLPRFEEPARDARGRPIEKARYGRRAALAEGSAASVDDLRQVVRQFVLHYDVCGCSRQCFKILHDKRNLSVHFMLDVDGTIYQTLDLRERAFHAGIANDHSVGIEIAHIGAYPAPGHPVMRSWYEKDADGRLHVRFPKWMTETGVRTPGFVAYPERPGLIEAEIQGRRYWMHDFTAEQSAALTRLTAALTRIFPRIELRVPRDAAGRIRRQALDPAEAQAFEGLLGHYHVKPSKIDPGPALDWNRLIESCRAIGD